MDKLVFQDGKAGAPFIVGLCVLFAGVILFHVLRPWPPRKLRWVVAAIVVFAFGTAVYYVGRSRGVVVDLGAGKVTENTSFLGIGRTRSWALSEFSTVLVEYDSTTFTKYTSHTKAPASMRPQETVTTYTISLEGPGKGVVLTVFKDVLRAEEEALRVASATGLKAKRRGYVIEVRTGDQVSTSRPAFMSEADWEKLREMRERHETEEGQLVTATTKVSTQVFIAAREGAESEILRK